MQLFRYLQTIMMQAGQVYVPPPRAGDTLFDNAELQNGSTPKPGEGGMLYIIELELRQFL